MYPHDQNDVFGLLGVSREFMLHLLPFAAPSVRGEPPAPPARRDGLLDRLDLWFSRARQRDVESYLAQSHDACEVERRLRDLERGRPLLPF